MVSDETYMRRALQLAQLGRGYTTPNPMVGAVIVGPDGEIIGEGFHRCVGEGHAEVNAVASVRRHDLLAKATMYVTLEPCSHYGRTPPCTNLIIDNKIPRVVVGMLDPFEKVSGRGVERMRADGIDVTVMDGSVADECRALNRRFVTAHTLRRPFVTLKWAHSADGYMACDGKTYRFSNALSKTEIHLMRARYDAIMVGSETALIDRPRLDTRLVSGRSPRAYVYDRRHRLPDGFLPYLRRLDDADISAMLSRLYEEDGVTSLLVEGGPKLLQAFIDAGLWDAARIETAPVRLCARGTAPAPHLTCAPSNSYTLGQNSISIFDASNV